jgi:hypothetical protein
VTPDAASLAFSVAVTAYLAGHAAAKREPIISALFTAAALGFLLCAVDSFRLTL